MKTNRPAPARAPSPSPQPQPQPEPDSATFAPAQKWPPATPYTRKSLRSLPYGASWLPQSSKSTPYAYLSRRLCFKIVEIPSLRGHSKFLHAQNILQDRLLNFRHPKMFDMRHGLNLRRTKIFDMGYEKISRLDLSNFSDICDALKLCRDPTSPVEIELLFYSC